MKCEARESKMMKSGRFASSLVVLFTALVIAMFFSLGAIVEFAGADELVEQTFSQSMPARTETDIDISHSHGNIVVTGWEKDEVKLDGEKIVKAKDQATAQAYADQMNVEIKTEGGRIIVKTIRPKWRQSRHIRQHTINYRLYAPNRLNVALKNSHGNVSIEAFNGGLKSNSSHGSLQIAQIGKDATMRHSHGNVEVHEVQGAVSADKRHGNFVIRAVEGRLELDHAHGVVEIYQVGGTASVDKAHGNLIIESVGDQLELRHSHGEVEVEQIKAAVDINKEHGNIAIEAVGGDIFLRGSHGKVQIENVSGSADIVRSHGHVRLHEVRGEVSVKNAHGRIDVFSSQPVTRPYQLRTEYANLKLVIPESSRVNLFAQAEHGRINSDMPLTIRKGDNQVIAERTVRTGEARIELSTKHGNISIDLAK